METTNAVMVLEPEWTQPLAASCVASAAPRSKLPFKGGLVRLARVVKLTHGKPLVQNLKQVVDSLAASA